MKVLNIKKIAFLTALVSGNLIAFHVNAQTNLITSFAPTVGTTSGFTLNSGISVGQNRLNADTNTISFTSGHSYVLSFNLNNSVSNPSGIIILSPFGSITFALSTTAGAKSYTFTSSTTSSKINFNYDNGIVGSFSLANILLVDGTAPAPTPTPSGPTAEEIAAAALLQASTQQSVVNTAQALQGTYALQNSVLANSFTYDCTLFDKNNICVSGGGRNTAVQAANGLNNTSALLIAAYRPIASVRVGAYADQNLSVNNGGSTVNLGNNTPLIGLFAAWNQGQNDIGTEVRGSIAYGQKNTTINRQVVGTSQAGSGSSTLNSQGAQLTAKYGFGLGQAFVVSPYAGVRYSQNNMGGYTEGTSAGVTAPLTYGAVNTNATTLLAGVGGSFRGIPKTNLFASAGIESDTNTSSGTVNATSSTITGLTPVNFNANPVKTRPTATVGATYDIEKNQRVGVTGIYRQEAYQAVSTTTVMATYTVGL
jgi:hypothetical protein